MMLYCPLCGKALETGELTVQTGKRGGFACPRCGKLLHFSQSHPYLRAFISLLISATILYFAGVRTPVTFTLGTLILWVPISLLFNAYCVRIMPLGLKPWKAPRESRTLIQRLNERNSPAELFGKRSEKSDFVGRD